MPSVYNYRHVELDKVGRGKRVIQPPGGQTADIFGAREPSGYSSASSQAGSDVASSRVHIDTDQQSISGSSSVMMQPIVDGVTRQVQQQQHAASGQVSPNGSVDSGVSGRPMLQQGQQPLLMADDFKPAAQQQQTMLVDGQQQPMQMQQQQQQLVQMSQQEANRTPKKTIQTIRRNPITGEIYDNPANRQQPVVRVRQPPGGRSSGIF